VNFHLLFLGGAYRGVAAPAFRPVSEPRAQELQALVEQIALRIARVLEKRRLVERLVPSCEPGKPPPRHEAMSWARRLKRVFGIEIDGCARCGETLKIIAGIEAPAVIARILAHLERTAPEQYPAERPLGARTPPARPRVL